MRTRIMWTKNVDPRLKNFIPRRFTPLKSALFKTTIRIRIRIRTRTRIRIITRIRIRIRIGIGTGTGTGIGN